MAKARGKNAPHEIRDIRFPTSHVPEMPAASEPPARRVRKVPPAFRPAPVKSPRRFPVRMAVFFACLVLATAVASGFLWYRHQATRASELQKALVKANLPADGPEFPNSLSSWLAFFKDLLSSYGGLEKASLQTMNAINNSFSALQELPTKFLAQDGPGVVADLSVLRDNLGTLAGSLSDLQVKEDAPAALVGLSRYASYAPDVERAKVAVERLLALLQAPGEHHVLVLLGNSAELRPGGGFLGSFADISFGSSTIKATTVHDVNEVDRALEPDIIPPRPMQVLVSRWRAADANWFFDYPESARKTLEIMGRSSFFASSTLDGAIMISPKVIQDLLAVTGPITLEGGKLSVNSDNVIALVQSEVQAGQANGAANPKEILSRLLPPLEAKLQRLDQGATDKLLGLAKEWLRNKDLAIFMEDNELMKVVSYYGADGASYVVPQSFNGDYLAVVNANLGGGKSDARIADTIDFESDLRADGLVEDRLTFVRESNARGSDEWWYRVTNQDYLQAFTPPGTELTAARGGSSRSSAPYAYSGNFEADPDLAAVEASIRPVSGFPAISQLRQSGKNVFATWLATPAGGSSSLSLEYRRTLKAPFKDEDPYTFVFERQSGARQSLRAVLVAPPGFIWKESGGSKYEYFSEAAPGRVVIGLTLRAI